MELSGHADASFRITANPTALSLLVVLMGNNSEQGIAMLAVIGLAIVSASSNSATK